jgi:hypothetical protein
MKKSNKNSSKPITKQQVRSMIQGSKVDLIKYTDTIITLSTPLSTVTFYPLIMPAVGTGQNARSADSIRISHFEISNTDIMLDSVTTSDQCIFDRMILFQNVGEDVIATADELLDQVTDNIQLYNSPYSYSNKGKSFQVCLDNKIHLNTFVSTWSKRWPKIKPSIPKLRYDAIASAWSTGLPEVMISRYAAGMSGGSGAVQQLIVRMWFYDV